MFNLRHSSLQCFNVCITHANFIASVNVFLGHHLTYEYSFPVYLPLAGAHRRVGDKIFRYVMRLRTRQDPHRCLCPELQRRYKCFTALWLAYLRYVRASLLRSIRGVQSFSTVLCMYIPVLAQLSDTFVLSKVKLLLEFDCVLHWVGVLLLAVIPRIFWLLHWSWNDSLVGIVPSFHLSQWDRNPSVFQFLPPKSNYSV